MVVEVQHLQQRLQTAVARDEVALHYQPVVDLSDGATVGVEALARWTDARLGPVPPDTFIALAESSGLIVELGRSVLRRACRDAAGWEGEHGQLTVAVNVSPVQLREPSFVDDVRLALADSGLAPERLCLEVTETAVVTDVVEAAETLHKVRDLGVRLALDDFGTGHSSLTLLRQLPLHIVKIDRSLIRGVATEAQDTVLVRLVVDAAHTLGLRVCAEGVEEAEQAHQLISLGCDTGQGWLFGRPAPVDAGLVRADADADGDGGWLAGASAPVPLTGSDDLVVVADRQRRVTYVSASCRRMLGRMPSEVIGLPLTDLLGQSHDEGPVTLRVPHRDGDDRWLRGVVQPLYDAAGDVREVLSVLTDVTSVVLGDKALADSEELFRSAFSGAPIGIALSDFDGRLLRVNPALAELLGRSTAALLEMTVDDITHPEDRGIDAANLHDVRTGRSPGHRVLKRYVHADGHAVPVEVYAASVKYADGEPSCMVAHILPAPTA